MKFVKQYSENDFPESKLKFIKETFSTHDGNRLLRNGLFKCECGNEIVKPFSPVMGGYIKSCGCLKRNRGLRGGLIEWNGLGKNKCSNPEDSSFNDKFCKLKHKAQNRNIEWDLSFEDFKEIAKQNCFYCNSIGREYSAYLNVDGTPNAKFKKVNMDINYVKKTITNINSLDRIDSSLGYIKNNVVSSCWICNRGKLDLSIGDFIKWIITYYNFVPKQNIKLPYETNPIIGAPHPTALHTLYSRFIAGEPFRNKEIKYNLTENEYLNLCGSNCSYCGNSPKTYNSLIKLNGTLASNATRRNKIKNRPISYYHIYNLYINGVDRVDSFKNYDLNNCVPCCTTCNKYKGEDLSLEQMNNHIIKIYNNLKIKGLITE